MAKEPKPTVPRELLVIDEAVRREYSFIDERDTCFYIWERMSKLWSDGQGADYEQYPANGLISNIQISPLYKNTGRYYWKERGIRYAAKALSDLLPDDWRTEFTFVPIPPSKRFDDSEYDGRMMDILKAVRPKLADIRPLISLKPGCGVDSKQKGLKPHERAEHYLIEENHSNPEPKTIMLFDDVLTTGCHYKAIGQTLTVRFPNVAVCGLFLARAVRPQNDEALLDIW